MSRYLLLLLLNLPLIIVAIAGLIVKIKLKKISTKRFIILVSFWLLILIGITLAQPIYEYLFANNLTQTEPLSLFDVVQLTAIVAILFTLVRTRTRLELTERRLNDLHQEISIQMSKYK